LNLEQPRSLTDNLKRELASQFRDPSQFYWTCHLAQYLKSTKLQVAMQTLT
jgi:hypothetical protein